jgi:gamma-glutamyltranspeptidase / glutathione hydrolase
MAARFTPSTWLMDKSGASSPGGMVVAKQDLAAWAGAEVLAEGGNAVDAAVAMGWVMAVMEPYNTSIAGAGYMVYRQADGQAWVVDFSSRAPRRATPEALAPRTGVAFAGPLSLGVPATVAGLCHALERFGTLPLARVMQPAIRVAEEGMPLNWLLTLRIIQELPGIRANPHTAAIFLINGDPGMAYNQQVLRQSALARTLRAIADNGAAAFYEGETAHAMVEYVRSQGGLLELDDLANYAPTVVAPLRGRFRDYDILTVPLPSPGVTTLESLQLVDGFDLAGMGHNSPQTLHVLAEAFRLAFADRDAYLGDPDFSDPVERDLLDPGYIAERRRAISLDAAMRDVRPGVIGRPAVGIAGGAGGTTHLCAVDRNGNMVSQTQTLIGGFSGFGVAGDTGVIMSCALQWFDPQSGAPNSVAPGKRPLTNMTPLIAERDGRALLAVGAPGSRRITNAVSQTTINVLEYRMPVQAAISAPRIDCSLGHVLTDDRISPDTIAALRALGHHIEVVHEFINEGGPATGYRGHFARPAAIHIDAEGMRHGGDYPFVEGMAIGVDVE